jgi:methylmalonyl-CoA mutase
MATPLNPDTFPPVTRDEWAAAVLAELGQEGLARRLRASWEDGIELDALHTAPGLGVGVGQTLGRLVAQARHESRHSHLLSVRQRVDVAAEAAASDVRDMLAGGADSIELDLSRVHPARVVGRVAELAPEIMEAGCALSIHEMPVSAVGAVFPTLVGRGVPVAFGMRRDALAKLGDLPYASEGIRLVRASGLEWFNLGAATGWSLTLALADGLASVHRLVEMGVDPSIAARQVELEIALGADLFEGVAAARATRLVWARALEMLGADAVAPLQLVVTAGARIMSRRDPWTNALRETTVAFAGTIGGADLIRLPAFDVRSGESAAARRLARTTPLILREEAGLANVTDPAGGSWHLDTATGLLAERSWTMLGELEQAGGIDAALASGFVAQRTEAQRAAREAAVRTRRRVVIGVSEFPDRTVRLPRTASRAEVLPGDVPVHADAEPFERLQDAADAWSATHGTRGRVLLLRLGAAADSAARVAFARGVAEAGGLESVVTPEVTNVAQATAAFASSDASAGILCGSDAGYAAHGALVASALKQAGLGLLLVAGRPGADADALRTAGVDDFVFDGADIVALLERLLMSVGVLR